MKNIHLLLGGGPGVTNTMDRAMSMSGAMEPACAGIIWGLLDTYRWPDLSFPASNIASKSTKNNKQRLNLRVGRVEPKINTNIILFLKSTRLIDTCVYTDGPTYCHLEQRFKIKLKYSYILKYSDIFRSNA